MTPFFRQSITRALCAAAWGVPGALLWAAPARAGIPADPSWVIALPRDGFICGNALREGQIRRSIALTRATRSGEYADSLISIASDPRKSASVRGNARRLLSQAGGERGRRWIAANAPVFELPPLIVSP